MRLTVAELREALRGQPDEASVVLEFPERRANLQVHGPSPQNCFVLRLVPKDEDGTSHEMTQGLFWK